MLTFYARRHAAGKINHQATQRGFADEIGRRRGSGSAARISAILSTKARAEASQVCLAANSTQACGEIAQRRQAGLAQILVQHPDRRRADHVARPGDRETRPPAGRWRAPPAAPGQTCRSCSETRRRRRPHRPPPAPRPAARRGIRRRGYFCSSATRAGPSPTITLVPGRSSSRNASRFFSTATRPTQRKTGCGRHEIDGARTKQRGVDAARPQHDIAKAALAQLVGQRRRRRHHRLARAVKPAQRRPDPGFRAPARAPRRIPESGCGSSW